MEKAADIDPDTWLPVESAVLCFVRDRESREILFIHKKTGLGAGLINAPGGRIEPGESPMDAAVRETREEVGLEVSELRHSGDLYFQFTDGHSIRGYVFQTDTWSGEPEETVEADPFWCQEDDIPYERMWADDSWWLPHMLEGRRFRGRFVFDGEAMLSMSLDIDASPDDSGGLPRFMAGRGR